MSNNFCLNDQKTPEKTEFHFIIETCIQSSIANLNILYNQQTIKPQVITLTVLPSMSSIHRKHPTVRLM